MKNRTFIPLVIGLVVACFIAGPVYADLTDGLVAYYPFEGDADDFSGNGNNGSIFEASFVPGVTGTGLHFDGIDDHVSIPNSASLDTSTSTIAFWWSFDELIEKSNLMLDKRNGPSYGNYSLYLLRDADYGIPGGGLTLRTEIGNGSQTISALVHTVPLEEQQFYFFAATYDESLLKLYLDGQLMDQTPTNMTDHTGDGVVIIGGRGDLAPGRFTNGIIDECRIYNRALSEAEIRQLAGLPAITELIPSQGGYGTKIKVRGSEFGDQQQDIKAYPEVSSFSFVEVDYEGFPALHYGMATRHVSWSDDKVVFKFMKFFRDAPGNGNYQQDPDEPYMPEEDFPPREYTICIRTIMFRDQNPNGYYDANDIYLGMDETNEVAFVLTDDPVICKIRPAGGQHAGQVIKIKGYNLGDDTVNPRIVRIHNETYQYPHFRIKLWSPTKIKFELPNYTDEWFLSQDFRRRKASVTVGTSVSNRKKFKVLKPAASPPSGGCWCHF